MDIVKSVCILLCGVGIFLTGMKLMGDGLKRGSNAGLRALFARTGNNSLACYGIGAATTALVQSSAATTVMSIGLVNAGIMTLAQASAFTLGARFGTSVTGILVSLSSISITPILMALAFVGICMVLFVKNDRVVTVGYIMCGLGVLFGGMEMMKSGILDNRAVADFFKNMFNAIDFPLLLVLVGALFTALIQSSSATTGILISLIGANTLTVDQALFLLIGATIGTCVTALLAAIGATPNAKRVAVFNMLAAVVGVIVVGGLVWAFRSAVVGALSAVIGQAEWQLSIFGVLYSLVASLIMVPLVRPLNALVSLLVRDKVSPQGEAAPSAELRCYYIDDRLLTTPAIAVMQSKREVFHLAALARDNLERGLKCITENTDAYDAEIDAEENCIDYITEQVSNYLVTLAGLDLSFADERTVGTLHHVLDDIERIGDHGVDFCKMRVKMQQADLVFSADAVADIRALGDAVFRLYDMAMRVFVAGDASLLPQVATLEQAVDDYKKEFASRHLDRLVAGECSAKAGSFFYTAISSLERVGDHLENVAYSIRSITGSSEA